MKIKVNEATPLQLDWLVAKCEGITEIGQGVHTFDVEFLLMHSSGDFNYSTDWSQGGPIIDRERISIRFWENENFVTAYGVPGSPWMHGPTPLIAAMRCYVASKLGDEEEIPEELR